MDYLTESAVTEIYVDVYPISREQLVDELGDPAVRFVEIVRGVAGTLPEDEARSTVAWRGLGKLALEVCSAEETEQASNDDNLLDILTEPQREVAELLVTEGLKTREAADTLGISIPAVKKRQQGVYKRLGIQSKRELGALVQAGETPDDCVSVEVLQGLTALDSETFGHIVLGRTNNELAVIYNVTVSAIEKRRAKIYDSLEVDNKYDAIIKGEQLKKIVEQGIVAMMGTNIQEQVTTAIKLCLSDNYKQSAAAIQEAPSSIDIPKRIVIDEAYGKLTSKEKVVLSALSNGMSGEKIRETIGISKRTLDARIASLKIVLGQQATRMLRLVATANHSKIQALWISEHDEHGLSKEESESEWLALALQGATYVEIADRLESTSSDVVSRMVEGVIRKLGVSNIFEASLILAPPTADMAKTVEDVNLSPLEEEIFVRMADNPTNPRLASSLQDAHTLKSIRQTMLTLKNKLGLQNRLQIVRLSYAYRLIEGERKFQGIRRANTRWNVDPTSDSRPSLSPAYDDTNRLVERVYKPVVARLVDNLMTGERVERQRNAGLTVPKGMVNILQNIGIEPTNSALISGGRATITGSAVATLAVSELAGPEFHTLQFQEVLIATIEEAIRSHTKES